jgi:hypothetical protein
MTVAIIQDCRNPAQRTSVLENPFWVSSGLVDAAASATIKDKVIILFSFPKTSQKVLVLGFATEVITNFSAGTSGIVGYYTTPTNVITPGTTEATIVGSGNQLEETTNATYTTAAIYFPAVTSDATQYRVVGIPTANADLITGAATTVYCICATFTNAGAITAGQCRYHMLMTIVPTAAA